MPIYEYQCNACGHHLEAFQKISEAPLTECPECHKDNLQKLISATSFQLKGTGWYATDFKDKNKKEAKTETKNETKEVKTETKDTTNTKTDTDKK